MQHWHDEAAAVLLGQRPGGRKVEALREHRLTILAERLLDGHGRVGGTALWAAEGGLLYVILRDVRIRLRKKAVAADAMSALGCEAPLHGLGLEADRALERVARLAGTLLLLLLLHHPPDERLVLRAEPRLPARTLAAPDKAVDLRWRASKLCKMVVVYPPTRYISALMFEPDNLAFVSVSARMFLFLFLLDVLLLVYISVGFCSPTSTAPKQNRTSTQKY